MSKTITPLGEIRLTTRDFEIIFFTDRYGTPCSVQQSSLADYNPPGSSALWLGVDRQHEPHDGVFDTANQTRMHLDLKQVAVLSRVLTQWLLTGKLSGDVS